MMRSVKVVLTLFICTVANITLAQHELTPSVTVRGTAIRYVEPDEVILNLSITKKANTLIEVRRKNAATTKQIMEFLLSNGVEKKDIQTNYKNIGPKVDYKTDRVQYFTSSQNISVKLKDLKKYDRIVDGIIGLGVYSVGNPQFRNSKSIDIREEVRKEAVDKAKLKAAGLASQLDQTIGKALSIHEVGVRPAGPVNRSMARSAEFDGGVAEDYSFAPGQIQVKAEIIVSFELK